MNQASLHPKNETVRGTHPTLLAVRAKTLFWSFNPSDDYLLNAGDVIVAMASPMGRAEIEAHLLEMSQA